MEHLFIQSGHASISKHDESLCGDSYHIAKKGDKLAVVLSDGLGSGVKANILSTLTSTILSTLMTHALSLDECVETTASTLPMCRERRLAYSTFTALDLEGDALRLVQYDNPAAVLLRNGKNLPYSETVRFIGEKEIHESRFFLQENDMLLLFTDGVTNAGIGKLQPNGWPREDVIACLERWYAPDVSPQHLAARLVNAALALCQDSPDDDITALAFKARARQAVNVIIGPPADPRDDEKILRLFFAKEGLHAVCGGTTAKTVSRFLQKPLTPIPDSGTDTVPAMASIDGVDLVTEGVITLQKVTEMAEKYVLDNRISLDITDKKDGASRLAELLFEQATDVNLFFGQASNPGNGEPDIDFEAKRRLVERLQALLTEMGKNVRTSLL